MLTFLFILVASIAAGYFLRKSDFLQNNISKTTTATVVIMLFIFGMNIGSNEFIMSNLHHDGLKASLIALSAVVGSACATSAYMYMLKKGGEK